MWMRLRAVANTRVPVAPVLTERSASSVSRLSSSPSVDGPVEAHTLPGEHAPGQGHRRHHPRVDRAPVWPELIRPEAGQEVEPVPARGQEIAHSQLRLGAAEGESEQVGGTRGRHVGRDEAVPDVASEPLEIQLSCGHVIGPPPR